MAHLASVLKWHRESATVFYFSPLLFAVAMDWVMRRAVTDLDLADDVVLMSDSAEQLLQMVIHAVVS